jgi:hypothetical protein
VLQAHNAVRAVVCGLRRQLVRPVTVVVDHVDDAPVVVDPRVSSLDGGERGDGLARRQVKRIGGVPGKRGQPHSSGGNVDRKSGRVLRAEYITAWFRRAGMILDSSRGTFTWLSRNEPRARLRWRMRSGRVYEPACRVLHIAMTFVR